MEGAISTELINSLVTIFLLAFSSFGLTMALTPVYTFFVYKYKLWKKLRVAVAAAETPHRNVPMMAGLVFVAVITLLTMLFNFDRAQTWLPLAALVCGALVGLIDDIVNVRGLGKDGLRPLLKFAMIAAIGLVLAWFFYYKLGYSSIHLPFAPFDFEIGLWMIPLFAFVVIATSNAVNISDGLDGLAGGLSALAFGFFGVIALLQGNIGIAGFCFTVVGALFAYTWFNILPARFFMSDVGSFALGTSLGVVAMLTDTLFLLPIITFVFAADTAASLLQAAGKKLLNRSIFLAAPLHRHFMAVGWSEAKVTMRFWLIGQVCGAVGLVIALVGGYVK